MTVITFSSILNHHRLEYNITVYNIEKTGRTQCSMMVQMIDMAMILERDCDECDRPASGVVTTTHCKGFFET